MVSSSRRIGKNCLISLDDFNAAYLSYFGISVLDTFSVCKRYSDEQLIYIYGLRKVVGLNVYESSALLGYDNNFIVGYSVRYACKKLCLFDESYSIEFAESWRSFRVYCRLFRVPLSGYERQKRWRLKHGNKNKRKKG